MINLHYIITDEDQQGKSFFSFDRITLVLGSALMIGGVALIRFNPFQVAPLRQLHPVAKIQGLEFESKRKIPGTLSWIDTIRGDTLYNGDQILTDEKSTASVLFNSGTKLTVGPQSLIRIEVVENEYQIQLVKGQLKVEGTDSAKIIDAETGKSIQVKSGEEVVSSRSGIVAKSEIQNILNDPKQGTVIDPQIVKQVDFTLKRSESGTATLFDANGRKVSETPFNGPISFATPAPGRYTLVLTGANKQNLGQSNFRVSPFNKPVLAKIETDRTFKRGEILPLVWGGPANANYRIIVKTPSGDQSVTVKGNKFDLTLNEAGTYGVQIALMEQGREYTSDETQLNIKMQDALALPDDQLNRSVPVKSPADFSVKNNTSNSPVMFEVSSEQDFVHIIKQVPAKEGKKAIVMEKPGVYYVRAKSQDSVSVPAKMVVTTPIAAVSKNYVTKQEITLDGQKAKISWAKPREVNEVNVQVARDEAFTKLIVNKKTARTNDIVELPSIGKYFWRILPDAKTPEYFTPSSVVPLEIAFPQITSPDIIEQQVIEYEEKNGKPNHVIKLKPYKNAKRYTLEVYADSALKKPVFKQAVAGTVVNWISNRSGKYFYRVKVEDVWGQVSEYSKTGELIFPISPMVDL